MLIKEYLFLYNKKPHFESLYNKLLTTTDMFNDVEKEMISVLYELKYENEFECKAPELKSLYDIIESNLLSNSAQYSRVRRMPNLIDGTVHNRYTEIKNKAKLEQMVSSILKLYEINSFIPSLITPFNIRERLCAYIHTTKSVTFEIPDLELPFYLATITDNSLIISAFFRQNSHRITPLVIKKAIAIATILGSYQLKTVLTKMINAIIDTCDTLQLDLEYEYVRLFTMIPSMQYVPFNITSKENIDRLLANKLGSSSYNALNNKFHSMFFNSDDGYAVRFTKSALMEQKTIFYHLHTTNFPLNRSYYDFFMYLFAALTFKDLSITDTKLTEAVVNIEASSHLSKIFKRNILIYSDVFNKLETTFSGLYQLLLYKGDIYAEHEKPSTSV